MKPCHVTTKTKSQNACLAANYREKMQGRKQLETMRSVGKMFGVSHTRVSQAASIKVQAPNLFNQIINGTLTITQALPELAKIEIAKTDYFKALEVSLRELDDQ